jgi:hypothetical protein
MISEISEKFLNKGENRELRHFALEKMVAKIKHLFDE